MSIAFREDYVEVVRALRAFVPAAVSKYWPPRHRSQSIAMRFRAVFIVLFGCVSLAFAGPWRAVEQNVYGWQLMTSDERLEHQRHLRGFESYDDCQAYQFAHHAQLEARARRRGVVLTPRAESVCERLRAEGRLK